MENPAKKVATAYGLYLGVVLILITVLIYAFDLSLMTEWYYNVSIYLVILILSIIGVRKAKKFSQELFTFKKAFSNYFLIVLIGLVISVIFSVLLFNLIDPDAAITLKELTMDKQAAMFEKFGMTEAQINEAMVKIQEENFFSIKNISISLAVQLVIFSIIGLIISLIFREKEPTHS